MQDAHPNHNKKNFLTKTNNIISALSSESGRSLKEYGLRNFMHINLNVLASVAYKDLSAVTKAYLRYASDMQRDLPTYAIVEVTYDCRRRCKGCYIPESARKEYGTMSGEMLEITVQKLDDAGIKHNALIGGEIVDEKTNQIIYNVITSHPSTLFHVYTNGDYFAVNGLDMFTDVHNILYGVSIDGIESHDRLRGKGSLDHVLRCFDILHEHKKFYGAGITLSKDNFDEVTSPIFLELLADHHVIYAHFIKIRTDEPKSNLTYDEFYAGMEKINALKKKIPMIIVSGTGLNGSGHLSFIPYNYVNINPRGEIRILRTDINDSPIGNIFTDDTKLLFSGFKKLQSEKKYT